MTEKDNSFYDRADKHIGIANDQVSEEVGKGKVSASFMYALSRFNSWICACTCEDKEEMIRDKADFIDYFTKEYREMLEENLDDYIENFDSYMKNGENT